MYWQMTTYYYSMLVNNAQPMLPNSTMLDSDIQHMFIVLPNPTMLDSDIQPMFIVLPNPTMPDSDIQPIFMFKSMIELCHQSLEIITFPLHGYRC